MSLPQRARTQPAWLPSRGRPLTVPQRLALTDMVRARLRHWIAA